MGDILRSMRSPTAPLSSFAQNSISTLTEWMCPGQCTRPDLADSWWLLSVPPQFPHVRKLSLSLLDPGPSAFTHFAVNRVSLASCVKSCLLLTTGMNSMSQSCADTLLCIPSSDRAGPEGSPNNTGSHLHVGYWYFLFHKGIFRSFVYFKHCIFILKTGSHW